MFSSCECRVLSSRGLCDELITRPEESYRICVSLSVIGCNNDPLHLQLGRLRGQIKEGRNTLKCVYLLE